MRDQCSGNVSGMALGINTSGREEIGREQDWAGGEVELQFSLSGSLS